MCLTRRPFQSGSGNMTVWKLFMAVCSVLLTVAAANWISEMIEQTITDAKSLTGNIKVVLAALFEFS